MSIVASMYRVKVGKQGRIVLPKGLREAYAISTGDEAVIIAGENEMRIHMHKTPADPVQDLIEISETVSIGLTAEELKKKSTEERVKHYSEYSKS